MRSKILLAPRFAAVVLLTVILAGQTGCVGATAHLMYFLYGNNTPAQYEGLEDSRVAVLCVSGSNDGPQSPATRLSREIGKNLAANVDKIEVVPQSEIANWQDHNDWDGLEYRQIGKAVKAEKLLVVQINSFSLHDGATMYKGRADVDITVYDMTDRGKVAWEQSYPQFAFPSRSGIPSTELNDTKFETMFLRKLAQDVARNFYAYDSQLPFAEDAASLHTD